MATSPTASRWPKRRRCAAPTRRVRPAIARRDGRARARACARCRIAGAIAFDYGNNIRAQAEKAGVADAFSIPGFVPEYIRPLFCRGKGPFRWAALSGDPADIARTDRLALEMFADDAPLCRWIRLAPSASRSRDCRRASSGSGYGERARFGLALNDLVRRGVVSAPIVIGRDHLDTGRSRRRTARPRACATERRDRRLARPERAPQHVVRRQWVSVHHGGGVGIGYSLHAGMVIVADGTREADEKLQRVLTCDPGSGVVRHADAGYPDAIATARETGIDMPMLGVPGAGTRR
jgi:urocanate hydratase